MDMLTNKAGYLMLGSGALATLLGTVLMVHKDLLAAVLVGAGALVGLVGYAVIEKKIM
jgi:hypothetical protein